MTATLSVRAAHPGLERQARELADELGLCGSPAAELGHSPQLLLTDDGLYLADPATATSLRCDLRSGRDGYRLRRPDRRQAVARALGLRRGRNPEVVDATAGLGRDGLLLAALGCRVTLVERVPALYALLRDGLDRARSDAGLARCLQDRVTLHLADAAAFLGALPEADRPAAVYLDPMHPPRRSSALVRKEMRLVRAVVGDDADADRLLPVARAAARDRVVVKRPRHAAPLCGAEPDWSVDGRTTRFDVYLSR